MMEFYLKIDGKNSHGATAAAVATDNIPIDAMM
jgi:hypothetical protein